MNYTMSVEQIKEAIRDRLAHTFAVSLENATDERGVNLLSTPAPCRMIRQGADFAAEDFLWFFCFTSGRIIRVPF